MAAAITKSRVENSQARAVTVGLVLMAVSLLVAGIALFLNSDFTDSFPYLYLLPWVLGMAVVLSGPSLYLYYGRRLSLYDPLVFATWTYFFPAFVLGGIVLSAGWSQPFFLNLIQDAEYNLPYTAVLIMLGYAGLAAGYFSSIGRRAGAAVSRILPTKDFHSPAFLFPGIFLLFLGTLNTAAALAMGVIGYQRSEVIESYTGIVFLTTLFWMQGSFILWYIIFRRGVFDLQSSILLALLLTVTIGKALFSGNRAALFQVFIIVILAFVLAGRKLNFVRTVAAGVVLSGCLIVGMIYGTTFRNVKGSEAQVTLDQYTDNIFETFDQLGQFDIQKSMQFALASIAERLDTLSSVAVVVSNYEQLAPYEESYGLDNNIWKDLSTFFIPRIFWTDKPVASEPRKYSDLYFSYGETSFAITPIGDLVRNYGPTGVPIGMFLFGIVIRFIYRTLIEGQPRTVWRVTMYFMLIMAISYEGFYGLLIPLLFKVGITAVVGILIVSAAARIMGHARTAEPV